MILALVALFLTATNAVCNHQFTTANSIPCSGSFNLFQANEDCTITCTGVNSCYCGNNGQLAIWGPSGHELTINIDSQTSNQAVNVFSNQILCAWCSAMVINVFGGSHNEFSSGNIQTPDNGLAIINCAGPAATLWSTTGACSSFWLKGRKGFGTGPGQTYIVDVSATAGRLYPAKIRYTCVGSTGVQCGQTSSNPIIWSGGAAQCTDPSLLPCQFFPTPFPTKSPIGLVVAPIHPGPKTIAGGGLGGPLARVGRYNSLDDDMSGVWVTRNDYYIMRICEVMLVLGLLMVVINAFVKVMRGCCNEKTYHYGKVRKYDTDITEEEHL